MTQGSFIVFEGIDGCGKSTQAKKLAEYLNSIGKETWYTTQPTDSPIGKIIREYINCPDNYCKDEEETFDTFDAQIAYLFAADRHWHLYNSNGIINKLNNGINVICDRYIFSTFAHNSGNASYKNYCLNVDLTKRFIEPDLIYFLDTDVDICIDRLTNRGNSILYESVDKLQTAQMIYQREFKHSDPSWCIQINANQQEDEIFKQILQGLSNVHI